MLLDCVTLRLRTPKIVIATPLKSGGSNLPSFPWKRESRKGASLCAPAGLRVGTRIPGWESGAGLPVIHAVRRDACGAIHPSQLQPHTQRNWWITERRAPTGFQCLVARENQDLTFLPIRPAKKRCASGDLSVGKIGGDCAASMVIR
jgi:hypothetical protein